VSVLHPILYHLFFVVICRSRNLGTTAAHTPLSTRGDPDSSSIARRRASGFLQVSSSKVSRYQHQGGPPASCAETPSMNANDS
jgi:hypothetical protein